MSLIDEDFKIVKIDVLLFGLVVYDINIGKDICDFVKGNVVLVLVCMIISEVVNWEKVIVFL